MANYRERGVADVNFINRQELTEAERLLLPQDRERAYSLAKSMLKDNYNCCFRFP